MGEGREKQGRNGALRTRGTGGWYLPSKDFGNDPRLRPWTKNMSDVLVLGLLGEKKYLASPEGNIVVFV